MKNTRTLKICIAGLLIAVGILIPMVSPIKVIIEPASFTLASHVAIFIAMFISPAMALAVAFGTTAGFFVAGFPPVVVLRALTHIVYAGCGAYYLQNKGADISPLKLRIFSLTIALIHGVCEVIVSTFFYFGQGARDLNRFMTVVILLVGFGTVIHSLIDFEIALLVKIPLRKQRLLRDIIK